MKQGKPATLSPLILLGTSTWTYEGWQGDVYKRRYPKSRFKRDCLPEYATTSSPDQFLGSFRSDMNTPSKSAILPCSGQSIAASLLIWCDPRLQSSVCRAVDTGTIRETRRAVSSAFVLFRFLPPRDKKYHDAVKAYEPYDKLKQPLPDMRDQTVKLVEQAIAEHRRAYVLVNNRTEGNAPDHESLVCEIARR